MHWTNYLIETVLQYLQELLLLNILVQDINFRFFVFVGTKSVILALVLNLDIAHISNIILTFRSMFNLIISLFLNHVFHICHCLLCNDYLLLNLLVSIIESVVGEHALCIFHLIHELAVVGGSTSAAAFGRSLLVEVIVLVGAHCVVSTSSFVSTGAWIITWLILSFIKRLVRVLSMAHKVSLSLRSLQRNLLIIYNSRSSRKRCHWSSVDHAWINSNRT